MRTPMVQLTAAPAVTAGTRQDTCVPEALVLQLLLCGNSSAGRE